MVTQSPLEHLRDKPHEEKRVVASGIAIAVVIVLFLGWVVVFLRHIQSGAQQERSQGAAQGGFNFSFMQNSQQPENDAQQTPTRQLQQIRDEMNNANAQAVQQQQMQYNTSGDSNQFVGPTRP